MTTYDNLFFGKAVESKIKWKNFIQQSMTEKEISLDAFNLTLFLASVPNKETDKKDFGINLTISIHSVHSLDEPIKQSERNELINNKMNIRYTNENQKKKNYSEINSRNPCFTVSCKLQQTDS